MRLDKSGRGPHAFSSESVPSILIRVIVFVHHFFTRTMVDIPARHRFGTYALIFALLAIAFSGLSKGTVWATSEVELSTTIQDDFGDDVDFDVTIENYLHLREMETEFEGTVNWIGGGLRQEELSFSATETYDELAQNSSRLGSSSFKDMDTAGTVAEWMIWIGIATAVISAILCLCSLAQIIPSRPTMISAGISSVSLLLTPVVWFLLLPSDVKYSNINVLGGASIWFSEDPNLPINISPSPSIGVFLSILGGFSAASMMVMIVLYNRSESTKEMPSWMIANEFTVLPDSTLSGLILRDEDSISLNFSMLKSQPKKLVMPIVQILIIILFSSALSGTWASYTIGFDEIQPGLGNEDISFTAEEVNVGSIKISYDTGFDKSWDEMGEVIGLSFTIGTIAIWMLSLSLVWRFAVSTGGAQKIPALCQHHRIIDTFLITGGSLLAFFSLLYFTIKSPSSAELFSDIPNEIIDGGTSLLIPSLMFLLVLFSIAVYTFGEHGAPIRTFLRSFDIPIPGDYEDDPTVSSRSENFEGFASLLNDKFNYHRISGLPLATIGVIILILLSLTGGGILAYKIIESSDRSENLQTNILYDLSYSTSISSSFSDSVDVADGQIVYWPYNQVSTPNGSSLFAISITFDYDETDADAFCDRLDVSLSASPVMFDSQNSTSQGEADDCSQINLQLFVERGLECLDLDGSAITLDYDQVDWIGSYCNEHEGGLGNWEFSISVEDVGGPLENGEDVTITVEYLFGTLLIVESI